MPQVLITLPARSYLAELHLIKIAADTLLCQLSRAQPTVADSKAVFVAYCADKKNKAKPVCQMSRVSRSAATHKPTLAPSSAATASAVPALVPSSASPTKPKKHESGTAEKQKAKRSKSLFG